MVELTYRSRRQLFLIADVASVARESGAELWLRGGWAMDFLIGEITRVHEDIDLFMWARDAEAFRKLLTARGYVPLHGTWTAQQMDVSKDSEELSFALLAVDHGGQIVVSGGHFAGAPWPVGMLNGPICTLEGVSFRVISREAQIEIKQMMPIWVPGRLLRDKDLADVKRLREWSGTVKDG